MQQKNTLFVGYGDLASRINQRMAPQTERVAWTRRAPAHLAGAEFWAGEVNSSEGLHRLARYQFDQVLITLTPRESTLDGYRAAYVETVQALLRVWHETPPRRVIFVSSSSVYGQLQGEWVDETSVCEPEHFSGKILLEAEQLLADSGLDCTLLRPTGIYGPGRDFLQRQVQAGKAGDDRFTNRIHVADVAGFIATLINLNTTERVQEKWRHRTFNLNDSAPVSSREVREWLAKQMQVAPPTEPSGSSRGGNKRVCNKRMLATGYRLQFPSFREGYRELL